MIPRISDYMAVSPAIAVGFAAERFVDKAGEVFSAQSAALVNALLFLLHFFWRAFSLAILARDFFLFFWLLGLAGTGVRMLDLGDPRTAEIHLESKSSTGNSRCLRKERLGTRRVWR